MKKIEDKYKEELKKAKVGTPRRGVPTTSFRQRGLLYLIVGVIIFILICLTIWSWQFRNFSSEPNTAWEKFQEEISRDWQNLWQGLEKLDNTPASEQPTTNKQIIKNPKNLNSQEIEELEKKAFGQ